jgi:predicted nucleic acid-binding protein
MKFELASADANILGHLYRSRSIEIMSSLFREVLVDEFIRKEIENKQPEILPTLEAEIQKDSWLVLMGRAQLRERKLISLYDAQVQDMEYIFMPADRGEKHAIALAQATGAMFVLTDDEKYDGPYCSIDRGVISNLEALGFWDLIFLNIVSGKISNYHDAYIIYNRICQEGYAPPYQASFGSRMKLSVRRLKDKRWFKTWCSENNISKNVIINLLEAIKQNGW